MLEGFGEVPHPVVGTLGALIECSERIVRSPLRQRVWEQHEIQWRNLVLVGDAARVMLPTSGQGTSFAIEDATVLADCLLRYPAKGDSAGVESAYQEALVAYAKRRVPRSQRTAMVADFTNRMALGESWGWRVVRDNMPRLFPGVDLKASKKDKIGWPLDDREEVGTVESVDGQRS
ncbi:hypothetical protein HK405_000307 [Cladochytrium tenue]|nr:hypothetical protein HK405_000307 [Cladochytrium tenue]